MKTLIFFGSARKKGITQEMLEYLMESLQGEVKIIRAYDCEVIPCKDCRYCLKNRGCSIKDNMQEIYKDIDSSDNIVFITPIYFYSVPGPLKILIDRCQVYWSSHVRNDRKEKNDKYGGIILAGGAPAFPDQFTAAELMLKGIFQDIQIECLDIIELPDADHCNFNKKKDFQIRISDLASKLNQGI